MKSPFSNTDPVNQTSGQTDTILGAMTKVTGTVISENNVVVNGTIEKGEIRVKGHLEIGQTARIKGNVEAQSLTVYGTIEGNVETSGDVLVGEHGKIQGDLATGGNLVIQAGGVFVGKSIMGVAKSDFKEVKVEKFEKKVERTAPKPMEALV